MNNIAQLCVTAMTGLVQSIADVNGKTFQIYEADELEDIAKLTKFPAAGVIYEGMRSVPESEKQTDKLGYSSELILSLCVLNQGEKLGTEGHKDPSMLLMDVLRKAILGKTSPTGHKWRFVVEAPAAAKKNRVIWVQRWAAPVQLLPDEVPPKVLVR